jgi:molybdopterin molybdotransferase
MIRMATVEQALTLIASTAAARQMPVETVQLADAAGRRLASPVIATVDQPPADVSAMDGYAVRFADMSMGARLHVTAESRAGEPSGARIAPGEAVRIFTGAHVPAGADHILIQEDTNREGETVTVTFEQAAPSSIRRKGRDFAAGAELVPFGHILTPGAIALAAAGNVAAVTVRCIPRIGVLATGDELVAPGSPLAPGQIVNSIAPALRALISSWGAQPVDLGRAGDTENDVRAHLSVPCDVVVSIGGASVGDYDVVRPAFAAEGFAPVFEKIAVKPGKPTWFSQSPDRLALGLPGNPAAAMVTAQLFLKPLIDALLGLVAPPAPLRRAHATRALPKTAGREEYLRAVLTLGDDGRASVRPADDQDSSLLSPFLSANALIRRPAHAPELPEGALADIILLA